ncbi:OmpL47-type beta-barrel domain-containing protein [Paenibacillus hamazuiensis]|uniref:OmpL47-type beta-barrel domain-containing protein n=1 Tax=Paenibacillus hamazuiensis TaxID=2936508 RepID=UPI00200D6F80|nr:family 16 glycoside hydrolase [Paenibacillus hamazuiensis]
MAKRQRIYLAAMSLLLVVSLLAPLAALPATVSADAATVLFTDDFQDGTFDDWQQDGGAWAVTAEPGNAANKVLKQSSTTLEAIVTNGNPAWTDYSYQVRMNLGDTGAFPGMLVRAQDKNNFYMFRINAPGKTVEFSKRVNGADSAVLASAPMSSVAANRWYTLKVEAIGNYFRCYLDGQELISYFDASGTFPSGKVGFRDKWGVFSADDITVSLIPAKRTPYFDDFESGATSGWTSLSGKWSVVDDVYNGTKVLRQLDPVQEGLLIGGVQAQFDDRITASYTPQDENASFGIAARLKDANNYYLLRANKPSNQLELVKKAAGGETVLGSVYYGFASNKAYSLRFELVGSALSGYVNGQPLLKAADNALPFGQAGLWAQGGIASIDNVETAPLTNPDLDTVRVDLNDSKIGRVYEGIGYVSSSGSSKLLMDYPEEQRQDIIDLLFKPNFGASLDHLKLEIGSDVNSSSGTEPSHMRSAADFDITRGSGLWLAQQAKAANPDLLLDALRWGTPRWIASNEDKYLYYKNYLQGAEDIYGLRFDYLGPDQNEGSFDRDYVVNVLRPRLNADGFAGVKLVVRDAVSNPWSIATTLKTDSALNQAVGAIGGHYIFTSTADAQTSGKPLWHSEARPPVRSHSLRSPSGALQDVVKGIMTSYVNGKMTKFEMQPFLEAYYQDVPYNTKGALVADKPWTGHYDVTKGVWLTAHFTQFAKPGWQYLDSSSAVGDTFNYVTLKKPDGTGDYSVIAVNTTARPQKYIFTVSGGLSKGTVHPWKTTETEDFVQLPDITPENGVYAITLEPYSVYSLTTTTGQRKGEPKHANPENTNLQLPYADSFDSYTEGKQPLYFEDQGGAFEVTAGGLSGKGVRQVITAGTKPVDWVYRESPDPYTLFGDPDWANYKIGADVSLEGNAAGYAMISGRIVDAPGSGAPPVGYNVKLSGSGAWELRLGGTVLKKGALSSFDPARWHHLQLGFAGDLVTAEVDHQQVADYRIPPGGLSSGQAALGSGYHFATFDNVKVEATNPKLPIFVKRVDDADAGIRYTAATGQWSQVVDAYTNYRRTLSRATAGDLITVNDRTTGTGPYQFNYSGTWSNGSQSGAYNSDNSWTSTAGSGYTVSFQGTQARIYAPVAPNHGIFAVSIDGGAETFVDLYAAARADQTLVYTSPVLPEGTHTLKVRVTGTKNAASSGTAVVADRIDISSGQSKEANLEYDFNGTGLYLVGIADSGSMKADVYVDGALRESIDRPAEMSGYKRMLYALTDLPNGSHTVKFVMKSNVQIDALEVVGGPSDRTPPVTTADAPAGWVNRDVTVNLHAEDAESGVEATYFTVDGGPEQQGTSVTLTAEGTHTIEYWSRDAAGNTEARHSVRVSIDKTAPVLQISLDKTELWPPNHQLVPIAATVSASDLLSQVQSIVLTSIVSNEPDDGLGDGATAGDIQGADYGTYDTAFALRAERSGKGGGRIYTVTYTATDKAGNTASASAAVTVTNRGEGPGKK